jgi:hypothetical protein
VDAEQILPRQGPTELVAQKPMEGADAQWSELEPPDALGTERRNELRRLHSVRGAGSEQHEHVVVDEPSQCKREGASRQGVEPLRIVDRDEHGSVFSQDLQRVASCNPERPGIRQFRVRLFEQERHFERAPPRRCQRRQNVVENLLEQIAQPYMGETALGLHRP